MSNVAPDLIFHVASGFMAAKHLFVANEIWIFEHLRAGSATLEELARWVGVQPRPLRIVVDAMVALGLVERFEGPLPQRARRGDLFDRPRASRSTCLPALLASYSLSSGGQARGSGPHRPPRLRRGLHRRGAADLLRGR